MSAECEAMGLRREIWVWVWRAERWKLDAGCVLVRQQSSEQVQSSDPEKKQGINVRMLGTWMKTSAGHL